MATTTYGTPYVSGTDLVANWPAASLTVANSIDAAGYYIGRGINAQTASYTGVLTDAGKTVTMTNAGATTFTVPANASVAYPTGTRINILNLGAGACTPTAGAGVTINGTITALATNESAIILKTATNTWSYIGVPAVTAPGLSLVTPTSVAGTGVTLSGGAVSFSASSTVSVNGCFTSTYDNYRVVWSLDPSDNASTNMRLRASGADITTSNYNWSEGRTTYAGSASASGTASTNAWRFVTTDGSTLLSFGSFDMWKPFISTNKAFGGLTVYSQATGFFQGAFNAATVADGFSFYPDGGTITGSLRVYGYRNS